MVRLARTDGDDAPVHSRLRFDILRAPDGAGELRLGYAQLVQRLKKKLARMDGWLVNDFESWQPHLSDNQQSQRPGCRRARSGSKSATAD